MNDSKTTTNIYQKIAIARRYVADLETKARGKLGNRGNYYTPEQVYAIATDAEEHAGIFCTPLTLLKKENGDWLGTIQVVDLENGQSIEVTMITAQAAISKASPAQNVGGTYTYTERYLLTSLFRIRSTGIVDVDKKPVDFPVAMVKGELTKEEYQRRFKK